MGSIPLALYFVKYFMLHVLGEFMSEKRSALSYGFAATTVKTMLNSLVILSNQH